MFGRFNLPADHLDKQGLTADTPEGHPVDLICDKCHALSTLHILQLTGYFLFRTVYLDLILGVEVFGRFSPPIAVPPSITEPILRYDDD